MDSTTTTTTTTTATTTNEKIVSTSGVSDKNVTAVSAPKTLIEQDVNIKKETFGEKIFLASSHIVFDSPNVYVKAIMGNNPSFRMLINYLAIYARILFHMTSTIFLMLAFFTIRLYQDIEYVIKSTFRSFGIDINADGITKTECYTQEDILGELREEANKDEIEKKKFENSGMNVYTQYDGEASHAKCTDKFEFNNLTRRPLLLTSKSEFFFRKIEKIYVDLFNMVYENH